MTPAERFQREHGAEWNQIINGRAFPAALELGHVDKLKKIEELSDEAIQANGKEILADFRGHLRHENFLIDLSVVQQPPDTDLGPEEYPDPIQEAAEQAESNDRPQDDVVPSDLIFHPSPVKPKPQPKPRKKRRKRRKRTKWQPQPQP